MSLRPGARRGQVWDAGPVACDLVTGLPAESPRCYELAGWENKLLLTDLV